jgi:hypothetical protein
MKLIRKTFLVVPFAALLLTSCGGKDKKNGGTTSGGKKASTAPKEKLKSYEDRDGLRNLVYDSAGKLTKVEDADGTWTYTYTDTVVKAEHQSKLFNDVDQTLLYRLNKEGLVTEEQRIYNPNIKFKWYEYDANGYLVNRKDSIASEAGETHYYYGKDGRLDSTIRRDTIFGSRSNYTRTVYFYKENPKEVTDWTAPPMFLGKANRYLCDSIVQTVMGPGYPQEGLKPKYEFDSKGRLVKEAYYFWNGGGSANDSTMYSYYD